MRRKKGHTKKRIPKNTGPCPFCKKDLVPDYRDYENLKPFLTERARIIGKDRSGVCSRHQRALGREIKRARHLALLPLSPSL